MSTILWNDYLKYRASLRGYDLLKLEHILHHSTERYFDNETKRRVAVGRHDKQLVIIPYEGEDDEIIPVTVHATTRQQIRFRLRAGRFSL